MAKSARAKTRRANIVIKKRKLEPIIRVTDDKRSIRLQSYASLQAVKKAEESDQALDEKTLEAAKHAELLLRNDDHKNQLREQGRFFFVHPHHNKDETFPVVENPEGRIDQYHPVIPAAERAVNAKKKDFKKIYLKIGKKRRNKRPTSRAKRF